MTGKETAESFFLFSLSVFSLAIARHWLGGSPASRDETKAPIRDDKYYLQRVHQFLHQLNPPRQSNFRVVALLLLDDGSQILGTNDEASASISGALCAERCAFLQYRVCRATAQVNSVYIVTDSDRPVPPGTLCREYMYGHDATTPSTRVVMQSVDPTSKPWTLTLGELYPYPSIYTGMTAQEQIDFGTDHEEEIELQVGSLDVSDLFADQVCRLLEAAHQACLLDDRDSVHPIKYGAAMAIRTDESLYFSQSTQIKALEYGATQDAVCQLASQTFQQIHAAKLKSQKAPAPQILAVVQVDQFGIPHVPFAPARSFLVEHGFGDCKVILTTQSEKTGQLSVQSVPARDLAPYVPQFR